MQLGELGVWTSYRAIGEENAAEAAKLVESEAGEPRSFRFGHQRPGAGEHHVVADCDPGHVGPQALELGLLEIPALGPATAIPTAA